MFNNQTPGAPNRPFRWISVRKINAYDFRIKVKYDEKLEFSLAQESNACWFPRDKNVVLGKKKGQVAFSKRQQQLVNSGNNISFLRIFWSLNVQLAYPNRYILLSV